MDFEQSDFSEAIDLAKLQIRMDTINAEYVDKISDEIFQKQPFFLTTLLGFRFDLTPIELEEIMKVYFLIWEYFRTNRKVQTIKVTETYFESILNTNLALLKYSEGESNEEERAKLYSSNLGNLKSKALFVAVLYRFDESPVLLNMEDKKKTSFF